MRSHKYSLKNFIPTRADDLIRIGNKEMDGGYVISQRQLNASRVLIGLGINYDWTFEEDFRGKNNYVKILCYDFSVGPEIYLKSFLSSLINVVSLNSYTKEIFNRRSPLAVLIKPWNNLSTFIKFRNFFNPENGNFFFKKGISDTSHDVFIDVAEMFEMVPNLNELPSNSIFIKMDIEQSEYDVLEDLLEYTDKINGLAIEFHDLKHFWNDFVTICDKYKEHYSIIHMHGNNCCAYIPGTEIPNFLEVTFIKKILLTADELTAQISHKYPVPTLDRPNLPNRPDMTISFE